MQKERRLEGAGRTSRGFIPKRARLGHEERRGEGTLRDRLGRKRREQTKEVERSGVRGVNVVVQGRQVREHGTHTAQYL